MGLYSSWDYSDPHHTPSATDLNAWPGTVGGVIMAACAHFNVQTEGGMDSIVHAFQNIQWCWNPKKGGRDAGPGKILLDRAAAGQGECGWLAWALHILLETPPPYGFGRAGLSTPRVYSGGNTYDSPLQESPGFVANHVGVHHGRPANIADYDPNAPMVGLSNLYKWGDHVVVEYAVNTGTFFWDPSYDTKYTLITDMAVYRVTGDETIFDKKGDPIGQHIKLNGGLWLRGRFPSETNYSPHAVYLGPESAKIPSPPDSKKNGVCLIL